MTSGFIKEMDTIKKMCESIKMPTETMKNFTDHFETMKNHAEKLDICNRAPLLDLLVTGTIFSKTRK